MEKDPRTGHNLLFCNTTVCNKTCPEDFEYKAKDGQCCGECTPAGCNVTLGNGQYHIIKAGPDTWSDPTDKCLYYQCIQDHGKYILIHLNIACDIKNASDCKPGFEYQTRKDECCGVCVQTACIYNMKDNTTKIMKLGEKWKNPDKPCEMLECALINGKLVVISKPKTCPSTKCQPGYIENPDKCCGDLCIPDSCVLNLENNKTHLLQPGESWSPPDDQCISYTCDINFVLISKRIKCPPFDISSCVEGTAIMPVDGCCPICEQKKEFCWKLSKLNYITVDGCTSKERVEETYCEGRCLSSSRFVDVSQRMDESCSCCKPTALNLKKVILVCPNGKERLYNFVYIAKCDCTFVKCSINERPELPPT